MTLPPGFVEYPTCTSCHGDGRVPRVKGRAIRRLRQEAGLSLRTMADKLGISAAYLSDMELGRRRMSFELAEEIVSICETELGVQRLFEA